MRYPTKGYNYVSMFNRTCCIFCHVETGTAVAADGFNCVWLDQSSALIKVGPRWESHKVTKSPGDVNQASVDRTILSLITHIKQTKEMCWWCVGSSHYLQFSLSFTWNLNDEVIVCVSHLLAALFNYYSVSYIHIYSYNL